MAALTAVVIGNSGCPHCSGDWQQVLETLHLNQMWGYKYDNNGATDHAESLGGIDVHAGVYQTSSTVATAVTSMVQIRRL